LSIGFNPEDGATVRGDRSTALEVWEIEDTDAQSELAGRQEGVISDLAAAGSGPDHNPGH
jgi:hypothetical protein